MQRRRIRYVVMMMVMLVGCVVVQMIQTIVTG